jgi:hypothetical protein
MVVASMANGFLMPRYGLIPVWYIGGRTLTLIGTALMCKTLLPIRRRRATPELMSCADTVNDTTSNTSIYGYNILVGTAAGCSIVSGFAIVQSLVPVHDIANAVSAMTIDWFSPSKTTRKTR